MPRRKATQSPPLKRPLEEFSHDTPGKKTKPSDGGPEADMGVSQAPKDPITGPTESQRSVSKPVSSNSGNGQKVGKKGHIKGDNPDLTSATGELGMSGGQDTAPSGSASDQFQEKRNRSLEALFQVTDNELQNISKRSPSETSSLNDSENGQSQAADLLASGDEDDAAAQRVLKIPVSEKGVEKYQLKSDSLEEQGLKLVYTKQTYDQYEPNPISYGTYKPRSSKSNQPSVDKLIQQTAKPSEVATPVGRKRKHPPKLGRHICPYCGRGCAKPSVLQKHIRAHTGERPYPCVACGFSFKTKSNLYKHCKSRAHALKAGLAPNLSHAVKVTDSETGNLVEELVVENIESDGSDNESDSHETEEVKVEDASEVITFVQETADDPASVAQEVCLETVDQGCPQQFAIVDSDTDKFVMLHTYPDGMEQFVVSDQHSLGIPFLFSQGEIVQPVIKIGESPLLYETEISTATEHSEVVQTTPSTTVVTVVPESTLQIQPHTYLDKDSQIKTFLIALPKSATTVIPSVTPCTSTGPSRNRTSLACASNAEVIHLPHPNSEPALATEALRQLEKISDKVASAASEGIPVPTLVKTMPDKSVCVTVQLPTATELRSTESRQDITAATEDSVAARPTDNSQVGQDYANSSNNAPKSPLPTRTNLSPSNEGPQSPSNISMPKVLTDPKSLTHEMLKERIQQLISANAAIVDTPMADAPRPKRLSRQNSEVSLNLGKLDPGQSGSGATSPRVSIPNIAMVPLSPLPLESELRERPLTSFQVQTESKRPTALTHGAIISALRQASVEERTKEQEENVSSGHIGSAVTIEQIHPNMSTGIVRGGLSTPEIKIQIRLAREHSSQPSHSSPQTPLTPQPLIAEPMIGQPGVQFPTSVSSNVIVKTTSPLSCGEGMSLSSTKKKTQNPEGSVIKDLLLKGRERPNMEVLTSAVTSLAVQQPSISASVSSLSNSEVSLVSFPGATYGPFQCADCMVSFRMEHTLNLHKMYYCSSLKKKSTGTIISGAGEPQHVGDKTVQSPCINEDIIAKYFPQKSPSRPSDALITYEPTIRKKTKRQSSRDSRKGSEQSSDIVIERIDPNAPRKKGRPKGAKTLHKDSTDSSTDMRVADVKLPTRQLSTPSSRTDVPVLLASLQQKPIMSSGHSSTEASSQSLSSSMIGQPMVSVRALQPVRETKGLHLNTALASDAAATSLSLLTGLPSTPQTPLTPQTPGTPNSSTSLWKLKLKGRLLMKRSMSVERMLSQERDNEKAMMDATALGVQSTYDDAGLLRKSSLPRDRQYSSQYSITDKHSPLKKRKIPDHLLTEHSIGRPLLLRAESAPCMPMGGGGDALHSSPVKVQGKSCSLVRVTEGVDADSSLGTKEFVPFIAGSRQSVSVPVAIAQTVVNPVGLCSILLRPITNLAHLVGDNTTSTVFLEPFPGFCITLPAISCTTSKAGSYGPTIYPVLRLPINTTTQSTGPPPTPGTPVKIPILKTPTTPMRSESFGITTKSVQSSLPVPESTTAAPMSGTTCTGNSPTAKSPEKSIAPLYLYGHSYPSLRGACHVTYCCVQRLQPMYVRQGTNKKISMYSNWRVAPNTPNPYGLTSKMLLTLYVSRYTSDPVYENSHSVETNSGILTHSSYWNYFAKNKNPPQGFMNELAVKSCPTSDSITVPACTSNEQDSALGTVSSESKEKLKKVLTSREPKRIQVFQGGFKSNEEYVYVRGRGRGKFVCEECGIRCKKPSMLKKHIRTHTDLRPYYCKHCNFSFKTKGNLTKHMKSKSHLKKCIELGITPVPTTVDDSQIDEEALAMQAKISKDAKIFEEDADDDGDDEDDEEEDDEDEDEDLEDMEVEDSGPQGASEDSNSVSSLQTTPELIIIDPNGEMLIPGTMAVSEGLAPIPSFVALQGPSGKPPTLVQIEPDKAHSAQSLGTVYGFPARHSAKDKNLHTTGGASQTEGLEINHDEIARSLLDLSKQPSETTIGQQITSPGDQSGRVARLDTLIGALRTRTTGKSQLNTVGETSASVSPSGSLSQKHTLVPAQGSLRSANTNSPVQVITIDSDGEEKSNSADGSCPKTESDDLPTVKGRNKQSASRPVILPLKSPTEIQDLGNKADPSSSHVSSSGMVTMVSPSWQTLGTTSVVSSSASSTNASSNTTTIASVGPIIGQLIRQEPIKIQVTGSDLPGGFLTGIIPSFHFTHPFPGYDSAGTLDRAKLTLPLMAQDLSATSGQSTSNASLGDKVLMISPSESGQNILQLVSSATDKNSSEGSGFNHGPPIGSLLGHIVNVGGSSLGEGCSGTQHIIFQGTSLGPSLLLPISTPAPSIIDPTIKTVQSFSSASVTTQSSAVTPTSGFTSIISGTTSLADSTTTITSGSKTGPNHNTTECFNVNSPRGVNMVSCISPEFMASTASISTHSSNISFTTTTVKSTCSPQSCITTVTASTSGVPRCTAMVPSSVVSSIGGSTVVGAVHVSSPPMAMSPGALMVPKLVQTPDNQHQVVYVMADSCRSPTGMVPTAGKVDISSDSMVDGRYVCSICAKGFQQQHQLTLHRNIHYFERRFRCEDCGVSFRTKGHLLKHRRSDSHIAKQSINTHFGVPTTDNPRPFKCNDCKVAFRVHGHLAKHLRSKMHITMLEKVGKLPAGTYAQIEKGDLTDIDASNCERTLESLHNMIEAANAVTLGHLNHLPPMRASHRHESGSGNDSDLMDDSDEEDDGGLTIAEEELGATDGDRVPRPSDMSPVNEHFHLHNRSPYEKFKEASNEKVTVEIKQEPIEFGDIGQGNSTASRYGTESDLESRESLGYSRSNSPRTLPGISGTEGPHKCGICRQGFKTLDFLNNHLITHAELRPYVCEYCDAGFTNGQSLKIHLQTHKRERPYVCGHCGDTFARSDDLKIHLQKHSRLISMHFNVQEDKTEGFNQMEAVVDKPTKLVGSCSPAASTSRSGGNQQTNLIDMTSSKQSVTQQGNTISEGNREIVNSIVGTCSRGDLSHHISDPNRLTENLNQPISDVDSTREHSNCPVINENRTGRSNQPVSIINRPTGDSTHPISVMNKSTANLDEPIGYIDTRTERLNQPISECIDSPVQDVTIQSEIFKQSTSGMVASNQPINEQNQDCRSGTINSFPRLTEMAAPTGVSASAIEGKGVLSEESLVEQQDGLPQKSDS